MPMRMVRLRRIETRPSYWGSQRSAKLLRSGALALLTTSPEVPQKCGTEYTSPSMVVFALTASRRLES